MLLAQSVPRHVEAGVARTRTTSNSPFPRPEHGAERQAHFPLTFERGEWVLRLDGTVHRLSQVEGGLALTRADERLKPVPWFTSCRVSSLTVVFLAGPSPFLAGSKRLAVGEPLTAARVSVFSNELAEAGDLAAEGLAAIAAGHPDASRWLTRLLTPWARLERAIHAGGLEPKDGEHVAGFFTALRVGPWLDFHRDVPVLLSHPLLSHLERIVFTQRAGGMRDSEFERTKAAIALARPGLEVSRSLS